MILITIGRNKDNRYVIEDPQKRLSGYHAEIKVCDDNSITLMDISLNGTTINGKRINKEVEVQINRGSEVIFGGFAKLDWNRIPTLPPIAPGTKVFSIGTHLTNRILINDTTNAVSRYHATLKIAPNGKMTINDHSANGTFINGSRIPANQDIPVKRKDKILYANSVTMDWSKIPGSKLNPWYIVAPIAAILVVGLVIAAYFQGWPPFKISTIPPTEIYAKYDKAVVCILHRYTAKVVFANGDKEDFPWGCTGTAFFIDDKGTLLTNRHITCPWEFPDQEIINHLNSLIETHQSNIVQFFGVTDYIGYALKDVDINRDEDFSDCSILSQKTDKLEKDVGLLRTKNKKLPSPEINPIAIDNAIVDPNKIVNGQKVFVMGYPLGIDLFKARSTGTTNTIQVKLTCQPGAINQSPDNYKFGLDAQMTHGASGSPVLNDRGQLIGVFNSGVDRTQGLNAAILAKHAKKLYEEASE